MKKGKTSAALFVALCIIGAELMGFAQANISKENIPSNIPSDVMEKIESLYSSDAVKRAKAAFDLGETGLAAIPAIQPLIANLGDDGHMVSFKLVKDLGYEVTTPAAEAAIALVKIGRPAVEPLITTLRHEDKKVRDKVVEVLQKITGQDFGSDQEKWQKWWKENKQLSPKNR
jgi:HEAT repeat protein